MLKQKLKHVMQQEYPCYSFEFFPPKTKQGLVNLTERIGRMGYSQPLWVDITHSKLSKTLELAELLLDYTTVDIMVHLAMTNMTKKDLTMFLDSCKDLGIRNILAIRGDPPRGYDSWLPVDDDLQYSADLVSFIRKEYGDYFTIFVGAYPEGHHNSNTQEEDLKHLKQKVDAGADAIITQLFYDIDVFFKFLDNCHEIGITVPIIPGLMPMQTYGTFVRIVSFTNISVPAQIWKDLEPIKHNDEKVKQYGIEFTVKMCQQIIDRGINTMHFYTFNLERSVMAITEKLNFYYATTSDKEMMITKRSRSFNNLAGIMAPHSRQSSHHSSPSKENHRDLHHNEHTMTAATNKGEFPWENNLGGYLRRKQETVRPIFWANRSESYLLRTAHWDEFPNGRWGDSRSPAYGEFLDHHLFRQTKLTVERRLKMWGKHLHSIHDVSNVFVSFLNSEISQLPWCSQSIGQETLSFLLEPLKLLNSFGFLTINSQPQVNGAPSSDPVVGWGNNDGYVYQKAYLEFFCSKQNCEKLLSLIDENKHNKYATLSYQAINMHGKLKTNVDSLQNVNAVTWGVFSNCEILQPTIVDPQSFIAWKDEAFSLWSTMWQSIYDEKTDSRSYSLIEEIKQHWFLVNIVENDYINGNIFEPFIDLLQDEKNSKHIKNVFTSSLQSQQKIWCCNYNRKVSAAKTSENGKNCCNTNPYLDEQLLSTTNSESANGDHHVKNNENGNGHVNNGNTPQQDVL